MNKTQPFPDCFYRVTIKGLCVRDGKVLLTKESPSISGKWELPGGGLDFGEDIYSGFAREVKEEMGLTVSKMAKSPVYVWTYRFENRRGMDWYYSLVVAYRVEFVDLDFTPTEECEAISFFSKTQLGEIELNEQTTGLLGVFQPEDFKEPF